MNSACTETALRRYRWLGIGGASLLVALTVSTPVQSQIVEGVVTSSAPRSVGAMSAEIIVLGSGQRARTDAAGAFRVRASIGDSARVRALGFRERRIVFTGGAVAIVLDELPTMLDRVLTTVGQREIRAGDSPVSATVLSRQDMDAAAAVSANQLLRRIPGLQEIASPPAQTSIAIRGLDQSRVLVLVDGEPVAGAMTENRDIGRLSTLAAERIEVVKGPSSVEYGSEALGGVINLVTAAPTSRLSGNLTARTGQLGRRESSVELSDTYRAVGVRLSGGWRESDRVTAINASSTTLDRVYDFRGDTRIRVSDRITVRTDVTLSQQRQRWPVGAGFNGFIDNHSQQGFVETQVRALGGSFRARVFGQRYAYQFRESLGPLPVAGAADSLEQRERMGRALLSYSRTAGRHSIDAGVQLSARGIVAPKKVSGDSANDRVSELFVRDAISLGAVLVTAGARTSSSSLWGTAISPSVGAVWHAAPAWRLHGNVARGFRAPSFKELRYTFINGAAGYQIVGNPSLSPESSWSASVGSVWVPASGVSLELEGYHNALSNLIATRDIGLNPAGLILFQNINVERARTEGVEANLRQQLGNSEWAIGYDYLRARDLLTGKTLDGRASHTARFAVQQRWSLLGGAAADLSTRYTSSAPRATLTQGAFLSLDGQFRLGTQRGAELSLGVTNLLDQRPAGWTAAFQRQVTLGIQARWR